MTPWPWGPVNDGALFAHGVRWIETGIGEAVDLTQETVQIRNEQAAMAGLMPEGLCYSV